MNFYLYIIFYFLFIINIKLKVLLEFMTVRYFHVLDVLSKFVFYASLVGDVVFDFFKSIPRKC